MKNKLVTDQACVKERLTYDEVSGLFTWKRPRNNRIKAGTVAGGLISSGYWSIGLDNYRFLAHRLAWLYMHGVMPPAEIDHIDGDPTNNRIANLRLATRTENNGNSRARKSASGLKGAHWEAKRKAWRAQIYKDGKHLHLGYFPTPEEAHAAYAKAAREIYGEFARTA
jgi:hypothetical protein